MVCVVGSIFLSDFMCMSNDTSKKQVDMHKEIENIDPS